MAVAAEPSGVGDNLTMPALARTRTPPLLGTGFGCRSAGTCGDLEAPQADRGGGVNASTREFALEITGWTGAASSFERKLL